MPHADEVNGNQRYSVPKEAESLLQEGILRNPLVRDYLPPEVSEAARNVRFSGKDKPSLPVNWRFAESSAALHALEAALVGVLLGKKYGVRAPRVEINT